MIYTNTVKNKSQATAPITSQIKSSIVSNLNNILSLPKNFFIKIPRRYSHISHNTPTPKVIIIISCNFCVKPDQNIATKNPAEKCIMRLNQLPFFLYHPLSWPKWLIRKSTVIQTAEIKLISLISIFLL